MTFYDLTEFKANDDDYCLSWILMNFNCQKANIPSNFFYCQLSFFTEHLIRNRGFEYWGWFDNATDSNS